MRSAPSSSSARGSCTAPPFIAPTSASSEGLHGGMRGVNTACIYSAMQA